MSSTRQKTIAVWIPGWYELDPQLEVGLTSDFAFWRVVPEYLETKEPLVFYNTLWNAEDVILRHGTIYSITHRTLGRINKIDTRGLSYTILLANGKELFLEAEEEPGKLYEQVGDKFVNATQQVPKWTFIIELESLSEPRSPS